MLALMLIILSPPFCFLLVAFTILHEVTKLVLAVWYNLKKCRHSSKVALLISGRAKTLIYYKRIN